jgi:hypothetical protein
MVGAIGSTVGKLLKLLVKKKMTIPGRIYKMKAEEFLARSKALEVAKLKFMRFHSDTVLMEDISPVFFEKMAEFFFRRGVEHQQTVQYVEAKDGS